MDLSLHTQTQECWKYRLYLSFNLLTSVNTPPPARLAWRQTRSFRPAGLEENFRDRMSQTHCIYTAVTVVGLREYAIVAGAARLVDYALCNAGVVVDFLPSRRVARPLRRLP